MASDWTSWDSYVSTTPQAPIIDSERWVSYNIDDLYPEWHRRAHCAGVGTEYYFGEEEDPLPTKIRQVRNAAKLCDVCPVFEECLRWSLENREQYGVWAGTSGRTRRKIFKMLDNGEADVDQVVRTVCDGGGSQFRNGGSRSPAHQGGDRLRADAGGSGQLRDLPEVGLQG